MSYALKEIELSRPVEPIHLEPGQTGVGMIGRWHDRLVGFNLVKMPDRQNLSADEVTQIANAAFAQRALGAACDAEMPDRATPPLPSLTLAICTKDRPVLVARLLASLAPIIQRSPFADLEVLVVDNASVDQATRTVAEAAGMNYVFEPKAGLDFARNCAVAQARGDILAFLDDDVVVDRHYLDGLARAWRSAPEAGGFSGLVLPYRLDTEAQVCFEERGGFGRGFERREFRPTSFVQPLHPAGSGIIGAGCNMAFRRDLVRELGGFDEALDTGRPLPGGGDLDIFYRVLRAGHTIVYEPTYAIYHEHRETIAQLRYQYRTWGLGVMAFLVKSMRHDPSYRPQHRALIRWWFLDQSRAILSTIRRRRWRDLRFCMAELNGGIKGLMGEYDRSLQRSETIRKAHL